VKHVSIEVTNKKIVLPALHQRDPYLEKQVAFYKNSRKPSRIIETSYDGIAYSKCSRSHCAKSSWQIRTVFSVESSLLYSVSERDIRRSKWTVRNVRKIKSIACTSAFRKMHGGLKFLKSYVV